MKSSVIEIEVGNNESNDSLIFPPLQRRVRGRFDLLRCAEPQAKIKWTEWQKPIPGQWLGIDTATGEAYLADPIAEDKDLAAKIQRRGRAVPPAREDFSGVDVPTWLHYMIRAVRSGLARVVRGTLPERVDGAKTWLISKPKVNPTDRLAAALEANTAIMAELLKRLPTK